MRFERCLYTWPLRLRSLLFKRAVDQDLDEELRYHVELDTAAFAARGLTASDARAAALRKFRGLDQSREACRDARGLAFVDGLQQDVRYGVRTLRRNPGFTAVAVLTLALGVGANTAIFSVVDGVLFQPLPFPAPEQLVSITGTYPKGAFTAMRSQVSTMDVAAYVPDQAFTLTGGGEAVRVNGALVSAELFAVLGARSALGRGFRPGEDLAGQDQVVLLSTQLWQHRFASDPAVVGRSIALDGSPRLVVGVMPGELSFPSRDTQLWVPLHRDARNTAQYWGGDFMPVVGRLNAGVTRAQAHADIRRFQAGVSDLFPWRMPAQWNADVSVIALQQGLVADVRTRLLILLAAVVLVLLIGCANVANLTLARAAAREREIGIRAALGAAPRRIARQVFTESLVLSALGGIAGMLLATQALQLLKIALPADTPRLEDVQMNWRVLAFTAAVSMVSGCIFGLAPVLYARRVALVRSMDSGGRAGAAGVSERLRAALTVAEVAVAVLLVAAAGLLVRTLWTLSHVDPGFRTEHVVTARITSNASVCGERERCLAFYRALESELRAAPGVSGAALVNTLPLSGSVTKRSIQLEGHVEAVNATAPLLWLNAATPEYFDVMGIRLESGRVFADADRTGGAFTAIVTAATARRFWPGQSALGKYLRFVGEAEWRAVVGVVADVRAYDLTHDVPDWIDGTLYVPYGPNATLEDGQVPSALTMTVRTTSGEAETAALLRRLVSRAGRDVAVSDIRPMAAVVADAVSTPASTAALLVIFAALALLLGGIGIYGVLSFLVARRTRDIAIRIALGAQRRDASWLVLREGGRLAGLGVGIGIAAALLVTRLPSTELHGVSALDPLTYAGVAVAVGLMTLAACYLPTRRAMRVEPLTALRDG